MDFMLDTAIQRKKDSVSNLADHYKQCKFDKELANEQIKQKVKQLGTAQEMMADAMGKRSEFRLELREQTEELRSLLSRAQEVHSDCDETSEQLEMELCGLVETRQSLYWEFVSSDESATVQDCQVGDWAEGPCSKSCTETGGMPGTRQITRSVIFQPAAGGLGAPCPTLADVAPCAREDVPCPTNCAMSEWSGWARCSRECGSGDQYRSRSVLNIGLHGGATCAATTDTRACNTQACRQDCQLDDWSPWGACSKRCAWTAGAPAGVAQRSKRVLSQPSSEGQCPDEMGRSEFRRCNEQVCDAQVTCSANQDILVLLDGSGSLITDTSSGAAEDANWQHEVAFAQGFVTNSETAMPAGNVRLGFLSFGGASRPQIISMITGDKAALESALGSASWPRGRTATGEAMSVAEKLLQVAQVPGDSDPSHQTVLLITDGRTAQPRAAKAAGQRLQDTGTRVVVALIQAANDPAAEATGSLFCEIASQPCSENVLRVDAWSDLDAQLNRFLAAVCPVGIAPAGPQPSGPYDDYEDF